MLGSHDTLEGNTHVTESWSRADLQRLTGKGRAAVDRALAQGLPHEKVPGKGAEYRIAHGPALRWLIEHARADGDGEAPDLTAARARLAATQEELLAVRLGRERGELVPAAEVRRLREAENQMFRDRMRSVPVTVAERLLDLVRKGGKAPEVAELLLAEIDAALIACAQAEVLPHEA